MGMLTDVFRSPAQFVELKNSAEKYTQTRIVGRNETTGEKFNVSVSQIGLAKIEQALQRSYLTGNAINTDTLLQEQGRNIYDEMLTDGHCFSLVEDLTGGAAAMPFQIKPSDDKDPYSREIASFVEDCFAGFGGSFQIINGLKQIYYSEALGYSLSEKVYTEPSIWRGKLKQGIRSIERLEQHQVVVSVFDRPKIITQSNPEGVAANAFKYVFMRRGRGYYGEPLLYHAFKAYFYKSNAMNWVARFIQRYGDPALIAYHTGEDQAQKNMQMLEKLVSSSYASVEDTGKDLTILQPSRDPNFEILLKYYDDEMSKVILSGTRQSSGSGDAGAYSATEVHQENADDRKTLLAKNGIPIINSQIIPQIVSLNFGKQAAYPKAVLGVERKQTPKEFTAVLIDLKNSGISLAVSKKEVYEKTGLAVPLDPTDVLMIEAGAGNPFANFQQAGGFKSLTTNLPPSPKTNTNESSNFNERSISSSRRVWTE